MDTKIAKALKKYGEDLCLKAYKLNKEQGEGAMTVAVYCGLTTKSGAANTRAADAAIDAGRYLATTKHCEHCGGDGTLDNNGYPRQCSVCGGEGRVAL